MARAHGLRGVVLAALLLTAAPAAAPAAAADDPALARARAWRAANERAILAELAGLLAIPNVATDSLNIRRNADTLVAMLARRGFAARRLEGPAGPPAVYGERRARGATRTLIFYMHYDGQPVDPAAWASDPWRPLLRDAPLERGGRAIEPPPWRDPAAPLPREGRLYGRSAADDKAPIVALLAALDALRASGREPSVHLKVFLEGEEEQGSPNLRAMLTAHHGRLAGAPWIFCDGPVHADGRPQVIHGTRGVMGLELTVYGAVRALHSGHYGNWAPNPAVLLAELLAGVRDGEGAIRIPGFTDDVRPLTDAERAALARIADPDSVLRHELQLARTEAAGARLAERILGPAINVRGLRAGAVGAGASNAIPETAHASLDFRLVPEQTPARVRERFEAHLRAQGWHIVHAAPDAATRRRHPRIVRLEWEGGYPAVRQPLDLPLARAVLTIARETLGEPVHQVPGLGGSLPLHVFEEVFRQPVIVLPVVNHDNRQHAADENLRLANLWDGVDLFAALLLRLGRELR